MSYLTQMAGLAYHNFISAAAGIAIAVALIRGIKRTTSTTIGNFWVDTTRILLYVLIPASLIYALLLVGQGVPQNLHAYTTAHTIEGQTQTIAQGPVASQEAIKMLGTNGGGFFNANSAHPFENPTPFSNFLQILSIFIIPAGLTFTLGRMTGSPGHGWAVLAAMFILFAAAFGAVYWAESQPHPLIHGAAQAHTSTAPGGNMEGKEVRNGIAESSLFATITTDASCGAVNGVHDSFTPLGGMVVLTNIMLGEVVFGGVGSGLYGILIFVVLSVFIAGLMVGRTPEQPIDKWIHSNVSCPDPKTWEPNAWHHVQISYSRDDLGNVTYGSVVLDGNQSDFVGATGNSAFALGWGSTLLTNFQLDGLGPDGSITAYLDKLTVSRW
jgi:K+-transporting ATPase ATPase A chain